MGCASLNFWDSLCLHAALLGNPSMEPCGDREGTPSCLRVPLPHVSLPKTLRRIRFFAGGQWGGGSWLQSCVFSPSLEFLPLLVPCPSTGQPLAYGISAAGAGLCSSSASVSLYACWQTLCSPQQYCRQTFGFVGGISRPFS